MTSLREMSCVSGLGLKGNEKANAALLFQEGKTKHHSHSLTAHWNNWILGYPSKPLVEEYNYDY